LGLSLSLAIRITGTHLWDGGQGFGLRSLEKKKLRMAGDGRRNRIGNLELWPLGDRGETAFNEHGPPRKGVW